jgi:hypothetical protein
MTDKKLFKLALDALEQMKAKANFECWNLDICDESISALKERLTQPAQHHDFQKIAIMDFGDEEKPQ